LPLGALDELEDGDVEAGVPGPQRHSERRRRLPFARTGVHRQDRRVAPRPRGQPIVGNLQRTALWHKRLPLARQATLRTVCIRWSACRCSSRTAGAPSWRASCPASPSRTYDVSQSTTTAATPSATSCAAAVRLRPNGSEPAV